MPEKQESGRIWNKQNWSDTAKKTGNNPFYSQGLKFACTRCSSCCRHESGYVFLSRKDLASLVLFFKTGQKAFIETFCRWIPSLDDTEQLSLKEKSDFDCIFWSASANDSNGGCSVYEARPLQCRAFPFWASIVYDKNSWKATARECPGMGKGTLHSGDSVEKWLVLRRKEPIIQRNIKKRG